MFALNSNYSKHEIILLQGCMSLCDNIPPQNEFIRSKTLFLYLQFLCAAVLPEETWFCEIQSSFDSLFPNRTEKCYLILVSNIKTCMTFS